MGDRAQFDIIAIGGGAAGLVTAAGAAGLGARAALVERDRLGGECLWTGCVPSKALIAAARAAAHVRGASRFGVRTTLDGIDFDSVMAHVRRAQQAIAPHDSPERFRALGVEVVHGTATFVDPHTIAVDGRTLRARHLVIATGSRPRLPSIPGLNAVDIRTNETIFTLERQPRSLVVLGAGAVGIELAQAFARLGTAVHVVEIAPRALPREDAELAAQLTALLEAEGVTFHFGRSASRVSQIAGEVALELEGGRTLRAEELLLATGRRANLEMLQLDNAGVRRESDSLLLNRRLQTTVPHIWAAGDVTGAPRFTHVADYQARLVLRNALFPFGSNASYDTVPWVTYTDPELAHLGLTEEEARARHGDQVQVWSKPFAALDRAIADGTTDGMVKLVATRRGQLLGAHVLGAGASSLIAELALAMRHRIPLKRIATTIHAYPTYAEIVRQTAELPLRAAFAGLTRRFAGWLVSGRH